jgi:DMSO reductase anchor subunit
MKPSGSIVFFTTASGAGYGMLIWLGLLAAAGGLPASAAFGATTLLVAGVLVTAGLLSSTLHLGHPERAWRALSQWRSSWLSREGVAALVTYVPVGLLFLLWLLDGRPSGALAIIAAVLAAATVLCTAMIYASLKTVRQWHTRFVPAFYLLAALFTGALCLAGVAAWFDATAAWRLALPGLIAGVAALAVKLAYWHFIDTSASASTMASATGLGHLGKVRSFEAPHTEENYLLKEFAFRIARKHAARLRAYALVGMFALPGVLLAGVAADILPPLALAAAAVVGLLGMLLERWLFFAEATHVVALYYGRAV